MSHDRANPRVPVSVSVNVSIGTPEGKSVRAEKIANLSLGGVFIEMNDPPAFGTELQLDFKLSGETSSIRCEGFVAWSTRNKEKVEGRDGVGVRLTGLTISDMKALSDFIQARAGK